MKSFTCTNINKDTNNQVISYELQDSTGKTIQVSSKKLKLMLENNKIEVVNLMIKNNEIIEDPDYQIKSIIAKLKMFGRIEEITYKSACGHDYYVIEDSNKAILYIPNDVEYLIKPDEFDKLVHDEYGMYKIFNNIDAKIKARMPFYDINYKTIKVLGGVGLTSACFMFSCCGAESLDLREFNTSNITDMRYMFYECNAKHIDLSLCDISKVTNMSGMFVFCAAQYIDLSSFDASNVTSMNNMFDYCEAQVKTTDRKILDALNYR